MDIDVEDVVLYEKRGRIAQITLNRPSRLNAISPRLPRALRLAVEKADWDDDVHVIVLTGAGRAFCSGYDLKTYAEGSEGLANAHSESKPWDPLVDYRLMKENTEDFMSLWRCTKPTICKVKGFAVAGGSDIALCCDLVLMEDTARIGYPPSRVWGIPTTSMWAIRLGPERAKKAMFTGELLTGTEAASAGLVLEAVAPAELDKRVEELATRIAAVPKNQLHMSKLVINETVDAKMRRAQTLSTLFDGVARHSPEGAYFEQRAAREGFHAAVLERDHAASVVPDGVSRPSIRFVEGNLARSRL